MGVLVPAAITECYRLDGLCTTDTISYSSGGWNVQDQGPAELVSSGRLLPGLQTAALTFMSVFMQTHIHTHTHTHTHTHREGGRGRERERKRERNSSSSYKAIYPILKAPPSWYNLALISSQRPLSPHTITLGVRASIYEFWGNTNIQSITKGSYYYYFLVLVACVSFLFFNWVIVALQCCVSLCCTTKWVSYMYTYIPSLLDLPPSLPIPPT